jgi:hypothetical protein
MAGVACAGELTWFPQVDSKDPADRRLRAVKKWVLVFKGL